MTITALLDKEIYFQERFADIPLCVSDDNVARHARPRRKKTPEERKPDYREQQYARGIPMHGREATSLTNATNTQSPADGWLSTSMPSSACRSSQQASFAQCLRIPLY